MAAFTTICYVSNGSIYYYMRFQFPGDFFNVEKDVQNTFREAGSGLGKQTAAVPESNSNFLDANFDAFSRMFGQTANGAPNNFRQQVQGGSPPGRQPESNFDNFFGRGRQQNSQQFPSGFKDQLPGDTGRNGGVGQRPSFTPEKIAELKKFAHDFIIQDVSHGHCVWSLHQTLPQCVIIYYESWL